MSEIIEYRPINEDERIEIDQLAAKGLVRTELTHFTIILIISKILVKNILMVSYLYHLRLFSSIILCKASICIIAPS